VRYVVEGSVRPRGDTVVVNLSLSETGDGAQLWTDRFEGARSDLDNLQRAMAGQIANALGVQLFTASRSASSVTAAAARTRRNWRCAPGRNGIA
jgi:hypothetical protein